jgi:hypothetical protein
MSNTGLSFKSFAAVTGLSAVSIVSGVWAAVEPLKIALFLSTCSLVTGIGYIWYMMGFQQE